MPAKNNVDSMQFEKLLERFKRALTKRLCIDTEIIVSGLGEKEKWPDATGF